MLTPCPITSGHLRLTASDQTPAGMSDASSVTDKTVPRTTLTGPRAA